MSKPTYAYWNIRGFAQHTRLLLKYLGVDYEDKRYNFGPAPDFSRDEWLSVKFTLGLEFPNLPYFIDGDVKLTEAKGILKYVARKYGPELVPTDALTLARADMVEGVTQDILVNLVNVTYGRSDDDLAVTLQQKLQDLEKQLEKKQFILGDKITYVDFFVYEVLHQLTIFKADILKPYANLTSYLQRFESLPQIADLVKSSASLPCYSPFAKYVY